jgi:hypothetical protein
LVVATFEDALVCADILRRRFDLPSLQTIVVVLRGAAQHFPDQFQRFHEELMLRTPSTG